MADETTAHSGRFDERTRREALSRNLAARICDERRSVEDLLLLSVVLGQFENARATPLLEQLDHDRFDLDEDDGSLYRHGWNHAVRHAQALIRIHAGLSEMRRNAAFMEEP